MKYLVDILMPVYNHGKYLQDALEGIVIQKTDFHYRLLIGEDCSTDNSREIITSYQLKYPDIIFPFYREFNMGGHENSKLLFNEVKAKYIAVCEGDDYWIDPFKLQKQIGFLENNPDYSICFHRVYELENGVKKLPEIDESEKEEVFTIEDLANVNFIHTPSVIYRYGLITLPCWYSQSPVGDYVLHMLYAKHGKIKYFPDIMAVYRKHGTGMWSFQDTSIIRKKWIKVLDFILTETFPVKVVANLVNQKHKIIEPYLKDLFWNDANTFRTEMERLISNDFDLSKEWLLIHYPDLVKLKEQQILNSKEYKTGKFFIKPLRILKNVHSSVFNKRIKVKSKDN